MSLRERLLARIAAEGPMPVADYMSLCLHDPEDGYYATRPSLGAAGDFITAPHVSQIFGELLGLWAAEVWMRLGSPAGFRLAELGPGDGTMMTDVLRAARAAPGFLDASELWLVETSVPLRAMQAAALPPARWADRLEDLPDDRPIILLANEFLDCLPIRQWLRGDLDWMERRVGLNAEGGLAFTAHGEIRESSESLLAVGRGVGALVARASGAALFIDYGRDTPGPGDTLQALRGHVKENPLAHPGLADLTAHVDFPAFLAAAAGAGAETTPIRRQGAFLENLGAQTRAAALARARPDRAATIARQLDRLVSPAQMGDLFKAACVHSPGVTPPGFEGAP
jgi:NADH dehydrogenase [ubiquinone] 1 alpha subcomplex assembly factor 7